MNLLFDPNVAYFLLVVGFLFTLLAIVTPGSGILEVGALFCLALAGYGIFNIGFNLWALILLALSVIPFIAALRSRRYQLYLVLSIIGAVIGSIYLIPSKGLIPAVDPFIALIVSLLAGGFIWFSVYKAIQAHAMRPTHDLDALIGQIGEAKTTIHDEGSVQVAGELWTARSKKQIKTGRQVRVVAREGLILIVEADRSQSK